MCRQEDDAETVNKKNEVTQQELIDIKNWMMEQQQQSYIYISLCSTQVWNLISSE